MRSPDLPSAALVLGLLMAAGGCADHARNANTVRSDDEKAPKAGEPAKPIPMIGDEISLVRIKADPRKYFGEQLVLCGAARISDWYHTEYRDAHETHYSLRFSELDENGRTVRGSSCLLYLARDVEGSSQIIDEIVKTEEQHPGTWKVLRAHVALVRRYRTGDRPLNWNKFELLDVQFLTGDGKTWKPGEIRKRGR